MNLFLILIMNNNERTLKLVFMSGVIGKVVRAGGRAPMRMVLIHKTGKTDAWRTHPIFNPSNNLKNMFPGLGTAIVLFAGYVAVDQLLAAGSKKAEQHGH